MPKASDSAAYYRNREQAERAVSDNIRQIHLTMAERYRELAAQCEMPRRPSNLRVVSNG